MIFNILKTGLDWSIRSIGPRTGKKIDTVQMLKSFPFEPAVESVKQTVESIVELVELTIKPVELTIEPVESVVEPVKLTVEPVKSIYNYFYFY